MSRELRKVLELDQSEDESEGELGRPSAPFPTPSTITRISERGEGKEGLDQQSSPRLRPSAARGSRAPSTQQPQPAVQSKPQPVIQSTLQTVGQSKTHTVGQSETHTVGQSETHTVGQSTPQPVVQPAGAGSGVPTVDGAGSTIAAFTVAKEPEEQR